MQTLLLLTAVYTAGFDPVPKVEPLPPITDKLWEMSESQLKQIGVAVNAYYDAFGHYPQNFNDNQGKPLLSWRVRLLPYLEQKKLNEEFRTGEAWDSDHNKKLIEKMPKVFAPVRVNATAGYTFYQGFAGEDTFFQKCNPLSKLSIPDGLSNTAMVVQSHKAVPWTKPEDLPFDAKKEPPKLGGEFDGDFNMLMVNGSVKRVKKNFDPFTMKLVIQRSDGYAFSMDEILKK